MQTHPYGRMPYGQQGMNMYTQNQPLPPGRFMSYSLIMIYIIRSFSTQPKQSGGLWLT